MMWKEKEVDEKEDKEDKDEDYLVNNVFSGKTCFFLKFFFRFVCFCGLCAVKTKKPPRGLAIFFFNAKNLSILGKKNSRFHEIQDSRNNCWIHTQKAQYEW